MRQVSHAFSSQMVPLDANLLKPLVTFSSFVFIVAELITEDCSALQKIILIISKELQMRVELITREDLESFKKELFEEIKRHSPYMRKSAQEPKEWLKSYEVRKLLGISAGTLQNLRLNGTLPYTKIGGLMYYRYEDIRKLLEGVDGS